MPRKYTGKISTLTVQRRQKNGDVYVYEEQRQYDPEKKYAVTLSAKLLGVKKKGTNQVVQTRPKRKFVNIDKEEVSPLGDVKAIRKHVGMMDTSIISLKHQALMKIFAQQQTLLLLTKLCLWFNSLSVQILMD